MRIYIDESGNFIPEGAPSRVCCETALVIPESVAPTLLDEFVSLRSNWTTEPEIKGSALSDEQTTAALSLLGRHDVVAEIHAVDVGHSSAEQVEQFRQAQARAFIGGLTPAHNANSRQFVHRLREEWLALPAQLMVQVYTLVLTVGEVIRVATNYYAQRAPEELGRFDWTLDPKQVDKLTPFETVWQQVVCPILQTESMTKSPVIKVTEFDYSALERFEMPIPEYIKPQLRRDPSRSTGRCLDLGMLLRESVDFPDSKKAPGIQLADIVASAFTKAMNGKLPPPVWRLLGPLMLEKPHHAPTARLLAFGAGRKVLLSEYHSYVLNALTRRAKRMMVA